METLFGTLVIAIPVLLVAYFILWGSYRPVFWMLTGALAVGLGYLGFVGASDELGKPIVEAIHGTSSSKGSASSSTPADTKGSADGATPAKSEMPAKASSTVESSTPADAAMDDGADAAAPASPASPSDGRYVTQ